MVFHGLPLRLLLGKKIGSIRARGHDEHNHNSNYVNPFTQQPGHMRKAHVESRAFAQLLQACRSIEQTEQ